MNKKFFIITLLSLAVSSWQATASLKQYEAPMDQSEWLFNGNPIGCSLSHKVPYYGKAQFNQLAGKDESLQFKLSYKKHPISFVKVASVKSLSADWFPGQTSIDLGETPIHSGTHIFKSNQTASWRLLNELEVGRFPTFQYQDFETRLDQVSVSLSTIGFKQPYDQFLDCLSTLVPHKLNELTHLTLHFDFDKHKVRPKNLSKLKSLAAYIKHSDDIEVVVVNGYADAKGTKAYNRKLSKKRIDSVQKILASYGAEDNKFKLSAYGEKYPVATNRKAWGRAKNRRVYIKVMLN